MGYILHGHVFLMSLRKGRSANEISCTQNDLAVGLGVELTTDATK